MTLLMSSEPPVSAVGATAGKTVVVVVDGVPAVVVVVADVVAGAATEGDAVKAAGAGMLTGDTVAGDGLAAAGLTGVDTLDGVTVVANCGARWMFALW